MLAQLILFLLLVFSNSLRVVHSTNRQHNTIIHLKGHSQNNVQQQNNQSLAKHPQKESTTISHKTFVSHHLYNTITHRQLKDRINLNKSLPVQVANLNEIANISRLNQNLLQGLQIYNCHCQANQGFSKIQCNQTYNCQSNSPFRASIVQIQIFSPQVMQELN